MLPSCAVANFFIRQSSVGPGAPLTPEKLWQLVYIADGWHKRRLNVLLCGERDFDQKVRSVGGEVVNQLIDGFGVPGVDSMDLPHPQTVAILSRVWRECRFDIRTPCKNMKGAYTSVRVGDAGALEFRARTLPPGL